jgi:hypothetical protein
MNRERSRFRRAIVGGLLAGTLVIAADRPLVVNPNRLIIYSQKYDKKLVVVVGYLWMDVSGRDVGNVFLYPHKEDFDNELPYSIPVTVSKQMLRDKDKINGMYVVLTGTVRFSPGDGNDPELGGAVSISDVLSCVPWSDPQHPRALRLAGEPHMK